MFAIRSRNGKRSFRRSGVEFGAEAWTFQDTITDAQRDEPMLLILEVEDESDPRLLDLTPLLKEEPEETSAPQTPQDGITEAEQRAALTDAQTHSARLEAQYEELQRQSAALQEQLTQSENARTCLEAEIKQQTEHLDTYAQVNQELGQAHESLLAERATMLAERDGLLAEIEALKAAQTPAPPTDSPATDAATSEPSSKDAAGKEGKNSKSAQAS